MPKSTAALPIRDRRTATGAGVLLSLVATVAWASPSVGIVGDDLDFDLGLPSLRVASIHGVVWHDQNQSETRDPNEPGLPGVIVYVDANDNCIYDRTDPATRTMSDNPATDVDEAGMYWLEGIDPGPHVVRVRPPSEHFPVSPLGGARAIYVAAASATEGWDFGLDLNGSLATPSPPRIDIQAPVGESVVENAEITIHPFCVRAFDITVESSDPLAIAENLSGVDENGCGGDTSAFSVRFAPMPTQQCFQLLFVDAEYGGIMTSIPVKVVPEPGFGLALTLGALGIAGLRRRTPACSPGSRSRFSARAAAAADRDATA